MTIERRRPREKRSVTELVQSPAPEVTPPPAEVPPPAPEAPPPADIPQPAASVVPRPVPGSITAAAVLLLVMATLTGLFGAIMLLTGLLSSPVMLWDPMMGRPDQPGFEAFRQMAQVFMVGFAAILLLLAAAHVAAGVGLLRRRGWARILGLVLAVLGLLVFALGVAGSAVALVQPWPLGTDGLSLEAVRAAALSGTIVGLVMTAIIGAFYAFVLIVLMRRGDVFA